MALVTSALEMANIDAVLRLPGPKFRKNEPILGKKYVDLMIALGAVLVDGGRAGKQSIVIGRLCTLFEAAISTHKNNPITIDLDSDRFYVDVLVAISEKHRFMAKYLTPKSIHHVIEIYRKAFARRGWRSIQKPNEKRMVEQIVEQMVNSVNGNCGDSFATEILKPTKLTADHVKLERLVKEWMQLRGMVRGEGTDNKVFQLLNDVGFPGQKPHETLDAHMLRLQQEFRQLSQERHADNFVLSYVSDQRRERLDEQHVQIGEYEKLLEQRRERLDEQHAQIGEYEKLLDQRRECIDEQHDTIERAKRGMASLKVDFDNWSKMKRPTAMDRDSQPDLKPNSNLNSNELGDKLKKVAENQTMIMEMQIDSAYNQDKIKDKLAQVMVGQDNIVNTQFQLAGEMANTRVLQGYIEGRQNEVLRRQEQVMDRQDVVMVGQDIVMGRQDVVMGRQGLVMGRQDEVIDNLREMMGYD